MALFQHLIICPAVLIYSQTLGGFIALPSDRPQASIFADFLVWVSSDTIGMF